MGNIYVMYIHLPGRHYDINLFHPQAFVSEQRLAGLPIFCCFSAVSRQYAAASSSSPGCLYRLEFILFTLRQVISGLPARSFSVSRSFRKIWVVTAPEFQVVLSVLSLSFWTHETRLVYNHCRTHPIQTIID